MFTFENGKTSCYMGYEHYLLQLLAKKYPIDSIHTSNDMLLRKEEVPLFPYVFDNEHHKYLADSLASSLKQVEIDFVVVSSAEYELLSDISDHEEAESSDSDEV